MDLSYIHYTCWKSILQGTRLKYMQCCSLVPRPIPMSPIHNTERCGPIPMSHTYNIWKLGIMGLGTLSYRYLSFYECVWCCVIESQSQADECHIADALFQPAVQCFFRQCLHHQLLWHTQCLHITITHAGNVLELNFKLFVHTYWQWNFFFFSRIFFMHFSIYLCTSARFSTVRNRPVNTRMISGDSNCWDLLFSSVKWTTTKKKPNNL